MALHMKRGIIEILRQRADEYETISFTENDPSKFMHMAKGKRNREATAFVASALSFGSRKQFLPKIQFIFDLAKGNIDKWIREGNFEDAFQPNDIRPFYRFFTFAQMNAFFRAYKSALDEYDTLGALVASKAKGNAVNAVEVICTHFREHGSRGVIPADAKSACKRVCMFLRWMVRDSSPVDIGLWAKFIDRKTLVIPLDTHVLTQAASLGLIKSPSASMSAAKKLTSALATIFPDDPVRGDFALFGYGVSQQRNS